MNLFEPAFSFNPKRFLFELKFIVSMFDIFYIQCLNLWEATSFNLPWRLMAASAATIGFKGVFLEFLQKAFVILYSFNQKFTYNTKSQHSTSFTFTALLVSLLLWLQHIWDKALFKPTNVDYQQLHETWRGSKIHVQSTCIKMRCCFIIGQYWIFERIIGGCFNIKHRN